MSELCIGCIDNLTVGGTLEDVQHDYALIECEAGELDLVLNHKKSEIITNDHSSRSSILSQMPDALVVEPQSATLLGSPLGNVESISLSICDKTALLHVMVERLKYLCTHDSLLLLRNAFAISKLIYLLRTSPCFLSPSLHLYDNELQNILSYITNTHDDRAWLQASLPVKSGGLEIRSAVHYAPSA